MVTRTCIKCGKIIPANMGSRCPDHPSRWGVAGPVVQPLPPTPGAENGVIGTGTFSNPALVAAMQADPDGYYVNVHTNVCQPGVIRGQLGDRGPSNN
jgi:CHRD domain